MRLFLTCSRLTHCVFFCWEVKCCSTCWITLSLFSRVLSIRLRLLYKWSQTLVDVNKRFARKTISFFGSCFMCTREECEDADPRLSWRRILAVCGVWRSCSASWDNCCCGDKYMLSAASRSAGGICRSEKRAAGGFGSAVSKRLTLSCLLLSTESLRFGVAQLKQ